MNTDFSYCPGYEPDGELKDRPQMCQNCKRYLEIAKRVGDLWWMLPQYDNEDCLNYVPTNSEKPNN